MRIVFVGPPGAGKGTQCKMLSKRFGIPHLSTGDILRQAKNSQTKFGKMIAPILDSGNFVDDATMNQIVKERIEQEDCSHGFILDGYPRTLPQAQSFSQLLVEGSPLSAVVLLDVPESTLIERISHRFNNVQAKQRPEDGPDAIPTRLSIYRKITSLLIDFYESDGLLVRIDGNGAPHSVFDEISQKLSGLHSV